MKGPIIQGFWFETEKVEARVGCPLTYLYLPICIPLADVHTQAQGLGVFLLIFARPVR